MSDKKTFRENDLKDNVIKKYRNRKLYSVRDSKYVVLSDIKKLVEDNVPFKVLDDINRKDITLETLASALKEYCSQEHNNKENLATKIKELLKEVA